MSPATLDEAWNDFAGCMPPYECEYEYKAMQVAFYVGAAAIYSMAMQAKKLGPEEAREKMSSIFDEVDLFMMDLSFRVHGEPQGNA